MLNVRNMIAILVTIAVLLGAFFVATLYYPINKRTKRMARSRAILEAQVESLTPMGGQTKGEKDIADVMAMDVNFFKKRNLSPTRGIPDLLEQINRLGSEMNIRFVAVKPLDEEDTEGYRRYPFLIETRAAYPELVNFVHRMENGLGLSLNELRIENDAKDSSMHRLQFNLNIYELKGAHPAEKQASAEWERDLAEVRKLVAVHRDPFGLKKVPVVSATVVKQKPADVATTGKPKRQELVLMGVMEIAGNRIAIINNKVMRPGEMIGKRRIRQIRDDHVILVQGDETYHLYLKGVKPLKSGEVRQ
ncbi:MAG: type 4a pilus biogenesis protein PilO [Proteobacteria bacterium]|nr:type 4a pilus biogenesis protein PilO [Pseudomonadota bacterium]